MAIELSMATANDSSLAAGEVQRGKSGSGHAAHGVMSFLAQLGAAAAPAKAETQALLSGDKAQASAKHAALMAKDDTGADDDKAAATTADDSALVLAQLQLNLSTQNASPSTTAAAAASRRLADLRDAKDAGTDALAADAADPSTGAKAPAAAAEDGTLILDEIDVLTPDQQAKLLRADNIFFKICLYFAGRIFDVVK